MLTAHTIKENLQQVRKRIAQAETQFDREHGSVALLAVSKTQPVASILAALEAQQYHFGENYLQEALEKITALREHPIVWHYIGAIQSNKTRSIAENFDWVHSVSSLKVAKRLSDQRPTSRPDLNICIQTKISTEASKAGAAPEALDELLAEIASLPRLKLRGLMAIPQKADNFTQQCAIFDTVSQTQKRLIQSGYPLDTLSLGMSADLEAAIASGSTMVRLGSAIFGARNTP